MRRGLRLVTCAITATARPQPSQPADTAAVRDTPDEPVRAALLPKRVIQENTRIQHEAMRLAVTADRASADGFYQLTVRHRPSGRVSGGWQKEPDDESTAPSPVRDRRPLLHAVDLLQLKHLSFEAQLLKHVYRGPGTVLALMHLCISRLRLHPGRKLATRGNRVQASPLRPALVRQGFKAYDDRILVVREAGPVFEGGGREGGGGAARFRKLVVHLCGADGREV